MPKYRKPPQEIAEEPVFFVKRYAASFSEWAAAHKDQLMSAALVAAVVVLGAVIWQRYTASRTADAWSELTLADDPVKMEEAVARYGATPAGPFLKLRLADTYVATSQQDKALPVYRELASDAQFGGRARYSLALAMAGVGKFDEAKTALESMSKEEGFWGTQAKEVLAKLDAMKASYDGYQAAKAAAEAEKAAEAARAAAASQATPEGGREARQAQELGSSASELAVPSTDSRGEIAIEAVPPVAPEGALLATDSIEEAQ